MDKLSAEDSASVNADNHIIIDLASWDKTIVADKIELIKKAMEQRRMITFRYFSPNGETVRRIEPYHLVFQWSAWYVWGYCTAREDYRLFKLTRLTELAVTDDRFAEREVPEYTCDKLRHTGGEISARVRFDKELKWRIIDEFGTDRLEYDENGDILVTFTWSDEQSLYRYLLTFGENAEIAEPEEYRRGFMELVKKISALYQI